MIRIVTKKCKYIDQLYLNGGDLNNDEVMDLCAFLCNHPYIRYLNLSNNFITNECIKSLMFCVNSTKNEAKTQSILYMNSIINSVELLLFDKVLDMKLIIIGYLSEL